MKPYLLVLYNKIRFYIKKIRIREFETNCFQMFTINSKLCFEKNSHIYFGDRLFNDGRMVMIVEKGAKLYIGNHVYFNEEAMISCKRKIEIGNGCKFGPNVKIFDNNHKFDAVNGVSNAHSVGEIVIGENCWIGTNVVILKGARIGRNSVIGAGCIIGGEIPEASIVTQGRDLQIQAMRI